eukprot:m.16261 g.16261  ORF g.16261 m.16261 type:complete len:398 (+) comp4591_c0_seq1:91-1284(+)
MPFALVSVFAVVALVCLLLLCDMGVLAQEEITVNPGHFFRVNLNTILSPTDIIERLILTTSPNIPSWLSNSNALPVLYGTPPDYFATDLVLTAVIRNTTSGQMSTKLLTIRAGPADATIPEVDLTINTLDTGASELLLKDINYNAFESAFSALVARSPTAITYLVSVVDVSPPRNAAPGVPVPPRTLALKIASTLTASEFTCDRLMASANLFSNVNATLDFTTCSVTERPFVTIPDQSQNLNTQVPFDFTRSKKIYNETIVPTAIIAGIVFLTGLLIILCTVCCSRKSTLGQERQQEALVYNILARNRMKTYRALATGGYEYDIVDGSVYDGDDTIMTHPLQHNFSEAVLTPTSTFKMESTSQSTQDNDSSSNDTQRDDIRLRGNAPSYKQRPKHNF